MQTSFDCVILAMAGIHLQMELTSLRIENKSTKEELAAKGSQGHEYSLAHS
jgi:hypothetical protein